MKHPYLIGEIGINHNGDMSIVKRLLDAVHATGWDCAKFQKRTPELCVPESKKGVMRETPWGAMTYLDYRNRIELSKAQYDEIDRYCKEKPLHWSASVWDMESLAFMEGYDIPFIKIPSAKLTNSKLVKGAALSGKKIILSTGMSTIEEIDEAVRILRLDDADFTLMHTNSVYPSPPNELNLRVIPFLKERYGCTVGYSGHEDNLEPSVIAVSLGAECIERHITLDHEMWGTDQRASLEVHAMDLLRKRVESITSYLGDGIKRVTDGEKAVRERLR